MPFLPLLLPMALRGVRSSIAGEGAASLAGHVHLWAHMKVMVTGGAGGEACLMGHVCVWAHTKVMVTNSAGGKDAGMQRAGRILSYRLRHKAGG